MQIIARVKINNMPSDPARYVVARLVEGAFWYYSTWKTKEQADKNASEFDNAFVFEIDAER